MTDEEIYLKWPFRTRYLRPEGWKQIKEQILLHQITSAIEFGSGVSTLLFNNLGIDLVSYETDPTYLRFIKSFNLANVKFVLWNNQETTIEETYGISLVDGILPRTNQLHYAQLHSRYIAIDDFNDPNSNQGLSELLTNYKVIGPSDTKLVIFRKGI
jgi:hypothetical protein